MTKDIKHETEHETVEPPVEYYEYEDFEDITELLEEAPPLEEMVSAEMIEKLQNEDE